MMLQNLKKPVILWLSVLLCDVVVRSVGAQMYLPDAVKDLPIAADVQAGYDLHQQQQEQDGLSRVIGGEDAAFGAYPFFTRIRGSFNVCGGSLVAPDVILTAAHCHMNDDDTYEVAVNGYTKESIFNPDEVARSTTGMIKHPLFEVANFAYDFMLLKLDSPVLDIAPVRLNRDESMPEMSQGLRVMGLGFTRESGFRPFPDYLQETIVNRTAVKPCQEAYEPILAGIVKPDIMFCAQAPGVDACTGDSGAPLMTLDGVQVGIVSFGFGCARPEYPGVYAKVSAVTEWLDENICTLSDLCENGTFVGVEPLEEFMEQAMAVAVLGVDPAESGTDDASTPAAVTDSAVTDTPAADPATTTEATDPATTTTDYSSMPEAEDKCCYTEHKPNCRSGDAKCCPSGAWSCPVKDEYMCDDSTDVLDTEGSICTTDAPKKMPFKYEKPVWWSLIEETFVGASEDAKLAKCKKRPYPPVSGTACQRAAKSCFWGNHTCADGDVYPTRRCDCVAKQWMCYPFECSVSAGATVPVITGTSANAPAEDTPTAINTAPAPPVCQETADNPPQCPEASPYVFDGRNQICNDQDLERQTCSYGIVSCCGNCFFEHFCSCTGVGRPFQCSVLGTCDHAPCLSEFQKATWATWVGTLQCSEAKTQVLQDYPRMQVLCMEEGTAVTDDYRTDRLRLFHDATTGMISQPPIVG